MSEVAMDFNLILTFLAIYEKGSASEAAKVLNISQPTVSKRLSNLRDIYDDELFLSSKGGLKSNEYSRSIYDDLKSVIELYRETLPGHNRFAPETSQKVFDIGILQVGDSSVVTEIIRSVKEKAPNILLRFHTLNTKDMDDAIFSASYNMLIAYAYSPPGDFRDVSCLTAGQTKMKLVCSNDHPRITRAVTREDYRNERFVALTSCNFEVSLIGRLGASDLEGRNIACTVPTVNDIFSVVSSTDYVAILFEQVASKGCNFDSVALRDLTFFQDIFGVQIIWNKIFDDDSANKWLRDEIAGSINKLFPFYGDA